MSIASRITAIEEHIRDVYDTIDYSYDTTDVDKNIINIPQNIFNGYINVLNDNGQSLWNNLEKVSASGEEATLENVETAPMKMVLNGNTSQNTTSGKNKFSTDYLDSYTYDTYTQLSKNSFEFNATTSWKTSRFKIPCKSNTDYYFNLKQDLSVSTRNVYIVIRGVQTGEIIYELYVGYLKAFNSGENTELMINIQSGGAALSGKIYNIQLEEGTSPTEFEEYTGGQPSPNPDYPQQVKVVKGENVVSVSGKNLLDTSEDNTTLNAFFNGTNGNVINDVTKTNCIFNEYIKVEANTSYTISSNEITNSSIYTYVEYDKNKNFLNYFSTGDKPKKNLTFVTSQNTAYIRIRYKWSTEVKITNKIIENNKIQLEQGSTATPYVPYSKTDYPINLGDIELCKINTYKDYFHKDSGKWYVHKEINKIVLNGSENWSERTNASEVKQFYVGNTIPAIKDVTQYCNYFAKYRQSLYNYGKVGDFAILTNSGQFFGCVNSDLTLENFKTLLSSNNLIVYYVLATPTETEITNTTLIEQLEAIYKAKSVKDKTYITQTNEELPFILDVEAIKEYEVN